MQAASASHAQKRAYLHFGGCTGFPISPAFFGQTFVMGNLTAAARHRAPEARNSTFVNANQRDPLTEGLLGAGAWRLASEKFNTELHVGYGLEALDRTVALMRGLIKEGAYPVAVFHYPLYDAAFAYSLSEALKGAGIRDEASIVYYLHTMADSHLFNMKGDTFREKHLSIFKAVDGTIVVSEAARQSYLSITLDDNGTPVSLNPATSFAVRNGVDPFMYTLGSERESQSARASVGLAPGLSKVVAYAGRIDNIKGSDFLASVLEHYERSREPRDAEVGFVIASSSILNNEAQPKVLRRILSNEKLISERRLRLVLDISKFTRGDERFKGEVEGMMLGYARGHGFGRMEGHPAYGGMTSTPVQSMADIYLHPSRSEGLPLSVVEALFSGAYIITTPVGGIPEIVCDERVGRLIDLPDIIKNPGAGTAREYNAGMKEMAGRIVDAITSFGGSPLSRERLDELAGHFQSYTHLNMFEQFQYAVSRIIARGGE